MESVQNRVELRSDIVVASFDGFFKFGLDGVEIFQNRQNDENGAEFVSADAAFGSCCYVLQILSKVWISYEDLRKNEGKLNLFNLEIIEIQNLLIWRKI